MSENKRLQNLAQFAVSKIVEQSENMKEVVIYSGRFQPFHPGHYDVYTHLVKKFGKDNVYIGTSNKTDPKKSPLNFKEKKNIITTLFNVPSSKVVQIKNPYAPVEVLSKYDPEETAYVTAVGGKDANRLKGKYFDQYKKGIPLQGFKDKGYVYVVPMTSTRKVSGTQVRNMFSSIHNEEEHEKFFRDLYPKFDKRIFQLFRKTFKDFVNPIKIEQKVVEHFITNKFTPFLNEISQSGGNPAGSDADDGPVAYYDSLDTYNNVSVRRAERIGWELVKQIKDEKFDDITEFPEYPDGPIKAVSSFPAGVAGKLTTTNQEDFDDIRAYKRWYDHVTRSMALAGYELIKYKLRDRAYDQQDIEQSVSDAEHVDGDEAMEEFEDNMRVDEQRRSIFSNEEIESIVDSTLEEIGLMRGYPSKEEYEKKVKQVKQFQDRLEADREDDKEYTPVKESVENFDRTEYYLEHFKNVAPSDFELKIEGQQIVIQLPSNSLSEQIQNLSNSLDIDRSRMPQIDSDYKEELIDWLTEHDIVVIEKQVSVGNLKAAQKHFDDDKVKDIIQNTKNGREVSPIWISEDGYVIDGLHRTIAAFNIDKEFTIDVYEVGCDLEKAIKIINEFPATTQKSVVEQLSEVKLLAESSLQINIPRDIKDIYKAFKRSGKKLYIVGGAVRDAILGKNPKDIDLATDAKPDEVLKIAKKAGFNTVEVGKQFGVVIVGGHEIATFRKDLGKGRRPTSVDYTDIEGDVRRRDLTINALFYDMEREEIVDLVGGIEDLQSKRVRTVGDPNQRFDEDPLRKLRAIRFVAAIGGTLDGDTYKALRSDPTLKGVSAERVRDEFLKGIKKARSIVDYLQIADDVGLLNNIFPKQRLTKPYIEERNADLVVAYLLLSKKYEFNKKYLNKLTYTTEEVRNITLLQQLEVLNIAENIVYLKKQQKVATLTDQDIIRFGKYINKNLSKFVNFELKVSGGELAKKGLRGPEIGDEIDRIEKKRYLTEARFNVKPGFKFKARKAYQDLKRNVEYVVSDIKGKIGDLQIYVTRLNTRGGRTDHKVVNVRSLPEFYSNVIAENVLQEGNGNYSYGCVMLAPKVSRWGNLTSLVDPSDVYDTEDNEFGIETTPHITLLYGLESEVDEIDVQQALSNFKEPIDFQIKSLTCFKNGEYDVLKFDIESPTIHNMNKSLKTLPHTSTYPEYHPHMTVAYLKPGMGDKYVKAFSQKPSFKASSIVYSLANSEEKSWKLG